VGAFAALAGGVPEPSSIALAGLALAACSFRRTRRRKTVASFIVLLAAMASLPSHKAWAVAFNFGAATEFVDSNDLDLTLGEVVYAINAGSIGANRTVTVGGANIFFEAMEASTRITHNVAGALAGFNGGQIGLYPVPTDSTALDHVLNTHGWNDEAPIIVTLQGLQVGANYRLQVLGPADTRGCCGARDQFVASVDGGTAGEIHRYRDLDFDLVSHVLTSNANFTADATTQGVRFYGPGDVLAGLAGFVLTSSSPHGLSLTVDRVSGEITMSNNTPTAISLDSYQVTSTGNSLMPLAWSSLSGRAMPVSGFPQGNGTGNGWEQATSPTSGGFAEWFLNPDNALPVSSLTPGMSINLGAAYSTSVGAEDLLFSYRMTDGTVVPRQVTYIGGGALAGDFNNDSRVDGDDFLVWQRQLGANVTPGSGADGSNNGVVDAADLTVWRGQYGQAVVNGNDAASAVPEPSGVVLALAQNPST
jgi:hypothetical protein